MTAPHGEPMRAIERREWAEANLPAGDRARYFIAESTTDVLALTERLDRLRAAMERISKGSLIHPLSPPCDAVITLTTVGLMADDALLEDAEAVSHPSGGHK